MLRLVSIALVSLSVLAGAHPHVEPPVEESKAERDALLTSETLTFSEGLPHPAKEAAAFAREEKRRDTRTLADFKFYTPDLKPDPARDQRLRQIIADPASLAMWTQKRCGGFHPDWSVNWRSGRKEIHALVCFGCKELIFISPEQQLRYNLTPAAFKKLQAELVPLRIKRPGQPIKTSATTRQQAPLAFGEPAPMRSQNGLSAYLPHRSRGILPQAAPPVSRAFIPSILVPNPVRLL